MDEEDLLKRTKNSLSAGKSTAQILRGYQNRGYKLEYAQELIKKAKRPKKIILTTLFSIIILFLLIGVFFAFNSSNGVTGNIIANPFSALLQNQEETKTKPQTTSSPQPSGDVQRGFQVTPQLISFILKDLGVEEHLHRSPINFEKPIIGVQVDEKAFTSQIHKGIATTKGTSEKEDILFITTKETLEEAFSTQNPKQAIREAVAGNAIQIQKKAGDTELFAKGYKELYDALQ